MATAATPATEAQLGERRFVVHGVDWDGYEALLRIMPGVRITYDRGVVELMSPQFPHELYRRRIGRLIEIVAEELEIAIVGAGSTTFKRRVLDRGLEPDECFYLGGYDRLASLATIDLDVDPPPDLAIEVDISSSSLDKMGIYAALQIREVWRFDGESLTVAVLDEGGGYRPSSTSLAFPFLPIADIPPLILDPAAGDDSRLGREYRAWVRDVVAPRRAGPGG